MEIDAEKVEWFVDKLVSELDTLGLNPEDKAMIIPEVEPVVGWHYPPGLNNFPHLSLSRRQKPLLTSYRWCMSQMLWMRSGSTNSPSMVNWPI